jgi:hypothetical protein
MPDYPDEQLPFPAAIPSSQREKQKERWREQNVYRSDFVKMIRRNFSKKQADGILGHLLSKYIEYKTNPCGEDADTLPELLWNYQENREMTPLEKYQLVMQLIGEADGGSSDASMQ